MKPKDRRELIHPGTFRLLMIVPILCAMTCSVVTRGQVAINTDGTAPNPSAMLDVKSTSKGLLLPRLTTIQRNTLGSVAVAGLAVYDSDAKKLYYHDGTSWVDVSIGNLWTRTGTNTFLSNSNDHVGIGTSTPGYIAGASRYLTVSTPGMGVGNQIASLELKGSSGTTYLPVNRIDFLSQNASSVEGIARIETRITNSQLQGELLFYTRGTTLTERMRIDENGNVGIGTSSPAQPLHVSSGQSGLSSSVAYIENIYTGTNPWVYAIHGRVYSTSSSSEPGVGVLGMSANSTGGGVGVFGQSQSNSGTGVKAVAASASGVTYGLSAVNYSSDGYAGYFSGGKNYFSGNVGIGTTSPLSNLHVHNSTSSNNSVYITPMSGSSGDSTTLFLAEDHDATFGMYWMFDGIGNQMELWGKSGTAKYGPHLLVNRDNGNMAVGSTFGSGYKLSVNGKIICTEVLVQATASWPDYVFRSGYPLMSLDALEQSIQENGHLPGLPSATEIETDGIQVGEMQRRIVEKVEELTLYAIQQGKQLKEMQSVIDQLKAENDALKKLLRKKPTRHALTD